MAGNIEFVQSLYAAFGRSDVAAILAAVDEKAVWASNGSVKKAPWSGVRQGRDGARTFFELLGSHLDFEVFEPREFLDAGASVVVLGRTVARAKSTGRTFESPWAHVFTIEDGRLTRFHEYYDTDAIATALGS